MDMVLSFCLAVTNFAPDLIEWVVWVSEQSFHRESVILSVWIFQGSGSLIFPKTESSVHEYLFLGQNHSTLSQSPAITSSLDRDATASCKIIISTFFFLQTFVQTNIWTAARAKYLQGLSKDKEHPKSLAFQRFSEFEILRPTPHWCIPASYSDILAIHCKWCGF